MAGETVYNGDGTFSKLMQLTGSIAKVIDITITVTAGNTAVLSNNVDLSKYRYLSAIIFQPATFSRIVQIRWKSAVGGWGGGQIKTDIITGSAGNAISTFVDRLAPFADIAFTNSDTVDRQVTATLFGSN